MRETTINKSVLKAQKNVLVPQTKQLAFGSANIFASAAGVVVCFIVVCALVPQWVAPYPPTQMFQEAILQSPSTAHLFGTDQFGRDVFSLVVHGSRDSLFIGGLSVAVGGIAGGLIGAFSGYIGGRVDGLLMRMIEILMTIPGILLALAIAASLGPSLFNVVFAIAVASIPGYARVMRGQVMSIKGRPFITASRSIGISQSRIFLSHVLPNTASPMIVMATLGMGTAILAGSGLSFLGLGVLNEVPDWGALLSQGRGFLTVAWWICTFPGLAITAFVLSINIIGDWLRDYLDPKKQRV